MIFWLSSLSSAAEVKDETEDEGEDEAEDEDDRDEEADDKDEGEAAESKPFAKTVSSYRYIELKHYLC